jgi:hypothetical protein
MKSKTDPETNIETEHIVQLGELERLNAEVAVLRDCVASLAKKRDDTAWRSGIARSSDRK